MEGGGSDGFWVICKHADDLRFEHFMQHAVAGQCVHWKNMESPFQQFFEVQLNRFEYAQLMISFRSPTVIMMNLIRTMLNTHTVPTQYGWIVNWKELMQRLIDRLLCIFQASLCQ